MVAGYQYTALSDLDGCAGSDRNVYGIIIDGISTPVKSKGSATPRQLSLIYRRLRDAKTQLRVTRREHSPGDAISCTRLSLTHLVDWYVKFKITDASTSGNGTQQPDPTYVMCFGPTVESLPRFEYGNIIRLHRAKVSAQEIATGSIRSQLVLQTHADGSRVLRKSSFVLFDSSEDGGEAPLGQSSDTLTFNDTDKQQLRALRRLWSSFPKYSTGVPTPYLKSLKEIELHTQDVICKVLMTSTETHPHAALLYVWDGNDTPPCRPPPDAAYTQQVLEHVPHLAQHQQVCEPELGAMEDWPAFGSVLPVLLPLGTELPVVGQWIKIFNLAGWTCDGQWQGLFRDDSRWQVYVDDRGREDESVRRRMAERQQANEVTQWASVRPVDLLECITRTNHSNPFATLRSVLQTPPPMKFRCLVRCRAIRPRQASQACIFLHEQKCWVYALQLIVEDSTACIAVNVFADDGATFFHGVKPTNLAKSREFAEALERKLCRLLGSDTDAQEPPWIQCCLRSYLDPEGVLRFRLFDTAIP